MKIVCACDLAINPNVMSTMKDLEKFGAEVVLFEDSQMQTPKAITEVMIQTEQHGADSSPANPELIELCRDADVVVVHASPINSEVLNKAEKLKYIAVLRSGIENINHDICITRGIKVISAPGRSAHAVADCTLGLMLAEAKNIARGHKALMEGKWIKKFVNFNFIHDLRNCTIGIIGVGQVGQKVIDRLKGFGPEIIVHDPFMTNEHLQSLGYTPVTIEELLNASDFVSIHLRLSDKTKNFIGEKELSMMKPTAYFINTARAGLVDEDALVSALQNKKIGGAALDVFTEEPLDKDNPLLKLDNVTLTPHVAGTSVDTFTTSVEIIKNALTEMFEDKPISGLVISSVK
jgi:D-3-phosphoglycerate dehydrogenase